MSTTLPAAVRAHDRAEQRLPPGPRLPGPLTTLWYTFDQPGFWAMCRRRYGRTFTNRLPGFPVAVVTSDRETVRRVLTGDPLARRHGNDILRPFVGDHSLLQLEPAEHLARRRLETPPFHGAAIRGYSERIRDLAAGEVASWPRGEAVAIHPRSRAMTLEIILELVLGVHDRRLRIELGEIIDWFNTPLHNLALFLPALNRRARWNLLTRRVYARLDRFHALLLAHVDRTRADPRLDTRDDVLALLVRARDEHGLGLTDEQLRDELVTLVSAGHETTATAMAWAADLLAHHPEVIARLRQTLAAGSRDYLKATAKEVLRARTLIYATAGRHLLEPFEIGEWQVGPETVILVDAQGIHSDPEVYAEPDAFRPERFLDAPPDGYAYLPFGGGAHRCLGASLAMLELELFLEAIVERVDIEPVGPPATPTRRGIILAPAGGGTLRVLDRR